MVSKPIKRTVVAIHPDVHRQIKTLAARKGTTLEQEVQTALARYLAREERRLTRVHR